jgi:dolichol-phosphate mannosyltransferase
VKRCRESLESAGHSVVVHAVLEHGTDPPDDPPDHAWTWQRSYTTGLATAAMAGLATAEGDCILVLDPARGYHPGDLALLLDPLERAEADLVVARSLHADGAVPRRTWIAEAAGFLSRQVFGVSDPFSGLVALTPEVAREVVGSFEPVGDRFVVDLIVRTRGLRADVPVRTDGPITPIPLSYDDLRHLKRLADDRFGNASRLVQFCVVGASGMVVDLTCYALFQLIFARTWLARLTTPIIGGPLDLAVAGALAIAVALTWNFSLNRRLTFNYARHGSIVRQFLTYALSNALGIALSFCVRLYLPAHVGFFFRHRLAAAVVGIVAATGISFSMARWVVFSHKTASRDHARAKARAEPVVQPTPAKS